MSRFQKIVLIVFLVLGIGLRGISYVSNRPFWRDESGLALQVQAGSYQDLVLKPHTASPLGYLEGVKCVTSYLGYKEWAFRLIPFLSSIFALMVLSRLLFLWTSSFYAVLGTALFSVSERAIYYAGEFRHYSTDLLFSVFILWIFEKCRKSPSSGMYFAFLCVGSLSIWFSYTSIIVLASVMFVWVCQIQKSDWKPFVKVFGIGLFFLLNSMATYFLTVSYQVDMKGLSAFWNQETYQTFLPLTSLWKAVSWLGVASFGVVRYLFGLPIDPSKSISYSMPMGFHGGGIAAFYFWGYALFIGVVVLTGFVLMIYKVIKYKEDVSLERVFLSMVVLVIVASGFHRYPFYGRFMLFMYPVFIMCVLQGVRFFSERRKFLIPFLIGAVLLHPALMSTIEAVYPKVMTDLRSAVAFFSTHRAQNEQLVTVQCGDMVYDAQWVPLQSGKDYQVFSSEGELQTFLNQKEIRSFWFLYPLKDRSKTSMGPVAEKTLNLLKKNIILDQEYRAIGCAVAHCTKVGVYK